MHASTTSRVPKAYRAAPTFDKCARMPSANFPGCFTFPGRRSMRHQAAGNHYGQFSAGVAARTEPLGSRYHFDPARPRDRRHDDRAASRCSTSAGGRRCEWLVPGLLKRRSGPCEVDPAASTKARSLDEVRPPRSARQSRPPKTPLGGGSRPPHPREVQFSTSRSIRSGPTLRRRTSI